MPRISYYLKCNELLVLPTRPRLPRSGPRCDDLVRSRCSSSSHRMADAMAELAPQARAALRARITLPPLPTRAHRLIHCASRMMAGVKSIFADECRVFEAVQAVQRASCSELGGVDGRDGLLRERVPCGLR